jgi:hypothetical protein
MVYEYSKKGLVDGMYSYSLTTFSHRRVALEGELISAGASTRSVGSRQLGLNHVDIALMICRDLVAWRMLLRRASDE